MNIINQSFRQMSSQFVYNRNPRNLEKMTIGYRPSGWHLENPGREYWHKLVLDIHSKHVTALLKHYTGSVPVTASTKEWSIRKYLFSTTDKSALRNLGRVFGQRCLETGIFEMRCDIVPVKNGRVEAFLNEVQNYGISLKESERYINPRPSDTKRSEKMWDT